MIKISKTTVITFAGAVLFSIAQPAFGQVDDRHDGIKS
jgi:hypothetical protein